MGPGSNTRSPSPAGLDASNVRDDRGVKSVQRGAEVGDDSAEGRAHGVGGRAGGAEDEEAEKRRKKSVLDRRGAVFALRETAQGQRKSRNWAMSGTSAGGVG